MAELALLSPRIDVLDVAGVPDAAPVVLLHEGLGSIGLWRGLPERLAHETGRRVLAFSRWGHGRSEPPPEPRTERFFLTEAREVLPQLLAACGIERPLLVGHSDGASIALVHAAEHDVAGLVLMAPHVFVEEETLAGIRAARDAYETGGLRERLARHHDDVDAAFHGWCDVWLHPDFAHWDLQSFLPAVTAPALLVQGAQDEYGTLAQLDAIERGLGGPHERLVVPGGHSPHLSAPDEVVPALVRFIGAHR